MKAPTGIYILDTKKLHKDKKFVRLLNVILALIFILVPCMLCDNFVETVLCCITGIIIMASYTIPNYMAYDSVTITSTGVCLKRNGKEIKYSSDEIDNIKIKTCHRYHRSGLIIKIKNGKTYGISLNHYFKQEIKKRKTNDNKQEKS